ncbi:MAG: tRNA pseudouridine(55) synthase TruB [Candidatus Margulisbacteria bacterium]|nr:tRNA pseudouridine(55) synthase TruB [Candidatus Margulisiibacteriota bacterium]
MTGFLLVKKPAGMTSYDVIRHIKQFVGKKEKIGHSGTLDPFATGLMIVAIGRGYTRQLHQLLHLDKTYHAQVTFGIQTDSYDCTGKVTNTHSSPVVLTDAMVLPMIQSFIGDIQQTPPIFSAKKINGKAAYVYARKNISVELNDASITIHDIRLMGINNHVIDIVVHCSKGTYIRSLAHDMGQQLSVGAHLSQLSREAIGALTLDDAVELSGLSEATIPNLLRQTLQP